MTLYSIDKKDLDKYGSPYKAAEYIGGVGKLSVKEKEKQQAPQKESKLREKILEFGL